MRISGGKNVVDVEQLKNFVSGLDFTNEEAKQFVDAFKTSDGSFAGKGDVIDLYQL